MRYPWILLAAACAPAADPDVVSDPSPWSYEPGESRTPTLTVEEVVEAASTWVPRLFGAPVTPLFEGYEASVALADAGCPATQSTAAEGAYASQWVDDCVTEAGTAFRGYAGDVSEPIVDSGWTGSTRYVYGAAEVVTGDGSVWTTNGTFALQQATGTVDEGAGPVPAWTRTRFLEGVFAWDGPGAAGTWLADGHAVSGTAAGYGIEGSGSFAEVDGTIAGLPGPVVAVSAVRLSAVATGWTPCPVNETAGTVSVRDAEGGWYDLVFDAPREFTAESDLSTCDGCGEVWFEGVSLGEACVDLTGIATQEVSW